MAHYQIKADAVFHLEAIIEADSLEDAYRQAFSPHTNKVLTSMTSWGSHPTISRRVVLLPKDRLLGGTPPEQPAPEAAVLEAVTE